MHIRPATRADSADLAILDDLASSGLASWLWSGAVGRGTAGSPLERGRQQFAGGEGDISWRNALVAEIDGDIAGMSVSYPLADVADPERAPHPVLRPLLELLTHINGHRYIDALAVYTPHRRGGIGRGLMECEIGRGGGTISLITEDDNTTALRLYRALGFAEIARRACTKFSPNQTTREWVLLTRPATS